MTSTGLPLDIREPFMSSTTGIPNGGRQLPSYPNDRVGTNDVALTRQSCWELINTQESAAGACLECSSSTAEHLGDNFERREQGLRGYTVGIGPTQEGALTFRTNALRARAKANIDSDG